MENKKTFDVVVIGGGPAGLAAAIYTARSGLRTMILERSAPGGKMVKTDIIENWPGDERISGTDLSLRMFKHAKANSAMYYYGDVTEIKPLKDQDRHLVKYNTYDGKSEIEVKAVIIATGMVEKIPTEVKGIDTYENHGVSYCAICDGPLFKGTAMGVIGGGNSAIDEALFLAQFATQVYVFVRSTKLVADEVGVERLKQKANVKIFTQAVVKEIFGTGKVEGVRVLIDNELQEFAISALFPYVGQSPVTGFLTNLGITNSQGYIETDSYMETKIKNIFAVGDVRAKEIRQITTATNDGTIAGKIVASRI